MKLTNLLKEIIVKIRMIMLKNLLILPKIISKIEMAIFKVVLKP